MGFRLGFRLIFSCLLLTLSTASAFSQCLDIDTILVDACDGSGGEGYNEMVTFHTGPTALNTATMNVNWPAQSWQGLAQDSFTASKVATLNAQIAALGGCGRLLEPTSGTIPANSKVILITSQDFSINANAFGALTQDVYILFQDNTTVGGGHFGNYGAASGIRTLTISFGSCSDTVSYDKALLVDANGLPGAANGATVHFTSAGAATYTNEGCVAPVEVFSVEAGTPISACPGATISLAGTAQGQSSVSWTAASGSFVNNASLATNYTLPFSASGSVTLTLTATNSCGNSISDTVVITVNSAVIPAFTQVPGICSGAPLSALPTLSNNGITGTWSPPIDNTQTQTYNFSPTIGQCASGTTMTINVTPTVNPDFAPSLTLCSGNTAPTLNATSPNGISGVWSPSVISNTASGNYVFTPNPGQCATNFTLSVTVTSASIVPDFSPTQTLCSGNTAPTLNATSPNGISGVWLPSVISNTASGNYVFTPNPGQCATNFTLSVTVTSASIVPDFSPTLTLCSGNTAPTLNATSPNGISGVWSPSVISNTASGNYVFTPNPGQCATNFTLSVTVTSANIVPDFSPTLTLCSGNPAPTLNATSPNGISGVWSPSVISNTASGNYVFTPNPGQCATNFTLSVTVTSANIVPDFSPTLTLCSGNTAPTLNATSPNGISGVWSPSVISNTASGNYVFTPNPGQCATNFTLAVTITSASIVPDFATLINVCSGTAPPVLNTTSPNGITGAWSPATINNTVSNNYIFTPVSGQCGTILTIAVNITPPSILPTFNPVAAICVGDALLPLPTTSTNGITGTWSPALDNTQTQTYTFTPNIGQCALNTSLTVTVNPPTVVPTFATTSLTICSGDSLSPLPTTSTNGIIGVWSPALSNTQNQTYTFTPNAGQCARNASFAINVTQKTVPTFSSLAAVCVGTILSPLPTTSLNGFTGTWSPALDNTQTTTYTFTPNAGQCASTTTLTQTISSAILPVFGFVAPVCAGTLLNPLPSVSVNGISGSWSPSFDNVSSQNYTFTPNPGQCAISGSLRIDVAPNPAYAETAYICLDVNNQVIRPATVDSHLLASDYTFTWTQDGNPLTSVTPSIQALQIGVYEVLATHRVTGCTITITTTVLAIPTATAIAYVNEDFADQQQIIVKVTGGSGDFMYQLNDGPYQPGNIFPIDKGGDYTIRVKDISGCHNFELQVTALNYPKYFTPNDDGYHDTWNVQGLQPSQNGVITIFDRYGKLLKQFRTTADGWNGIYNGRPLPGTDYWFVIDYQTLSGVTKTFRSHFSLKR
ncbi:T9SS type B sorting domain-containing protein [Flavobacterium sp. CYK-4]|uniref:T9SS type B sorting domain-containing protein n=1 Tax=Flavobacterium lotistagni TaxID=2709660 RepID=UPI00140E21A5|nr:T9SS type B sorting domain-containing protein [Flavobacterium lotistagni]NHM06369.1 T9SS type B sorting domain-containing protein [Flavobacterium lotistagni]